MRTKRSILTDLKSRENAYREASELLTEWGRWLTGLASWQWFVTLTLRDPARNDHNWTKPGWGLMKRAQKDFLKAIRPALGQLYWVSALELQEDRDVPHTHLLVAGLDDTRYASVATWYWQKYGFIRVLEYDPRRGAGYYLCKYITKELADVRFSDSLLTRVDPCVILGSGGSE